MPEVLAPPVLEHFVDRRAFHAAGRPMSHERRQFADCYEGMSAEAQELGKAIDGYKLRHRRRFVTYEEMLGVIQSLGYEKK